MPDISPLLHIPTILTRVVAKGWMVGSILARVVSLGVGVEIGEWFPQNALGAPLSLRV